MCYTLHTRLIPMSIFLLRKNSFTFSVIQCYVHCNGYSLNSLNPSHPKKKKKKMDVMEMGEVGFIMGGWEIFKVCLHSWQRNANPLFYEDPHYITCLLFFEFCPLSPPTSLSPTRGWYRLLPTLVYWFWALEFGCAKFNLK